MDSNSRTNESLWTSTGTITVLTDPYIKEIMPQSVVGVNVEYVTILNVALKPGSTRSDRREIYELMDIIREKFPEQEFDLNVRIDGQL